MKGSASVWDPVELLYFSQLTDEDLGFPQKNNMNFDLRNYPFIDRNKEDGNL